MDVGLVPTCQCGERVTLAECRETPASDGTADAMERAFAWPLQEMSEQVSIEPGDGEPFGAAGSARKYVHVMGTQSTFAEQTERVGARAQSEQRRGAR